MALGLGTMVGWKRIVVTVGEKIGKDHLTYGQGAAAEITAMFTIGAADWFGLPVSTTHVLSSGIAGTMAANHTGLQWATVQEPGDGLGADAAGLDDAGRVPVLGLPQYLLIAPLKSGEMPPDRSCSAGILPARWAGLARQFSAANDIEAALRLGTFQSFLYRAMASRQKRYAIFQAAGSRSFRASATSSAPSR